VAVTSMANSSMRDFQKFNQMSSETACSGGTVTEVDGYRYHTFTSDGTFGVPARGPLGIEYLVIAGGGSGGGANSGSARASGGGGAGGYLATSASLMVGDYSVTVGAGGAQSAVSSAGNQGSNSVFLTSTSIGGGRSTGKTAGESGGSGAGGGGLGGAVAGAGAGEANTGGGGGGGSNDNGASGQAGGSGIVVIRYPIAVAQ